MNLRATRHWFSRYNIIRKAAYGFALVAFACFLLGVWVNPSINNPNQNETTQSEITPFQGQRSFDFLNPLTNTSVPLTLYYNMTTDALTQNNPVNIQLYLELYTGGITLINFDPVRVKVSNAVENTSFLAPFGIPSEFSLENTANITWNNVTLFRYWTGNQTVRFETIGSPQIELEISVIFPPEARAIIDGLFNLTSHQGTIDEYNYLSQWQPFRTTITIPSINIESAKVTELELKQAQQEKDQKVNEKTNESLTFFVLLFASIDVAVVLYDHSDKKNNKPHYESVYKSYKHNSQWKMSNRNKKKQGHPNKHEDED